jgi:glutathione peroxidase
MAQTSIYDFTMTTIEGQQFDFSQLKDKPMLIVNVASKCGYTPQYDDLQRLHSDFGSKITVLGFPANNFGGQEPGTNDDIALFCKKNYGVDFQMFEKSDVVGDKANDLYKWLAEKSGVVPSWNFCKYLVSGDGQSVTFLPSSINPLEEEIIGEL